jgi:S1-C subfamily serine protease
MHRILLSFLVLYCTACCYRPDARPTLSEVWRLEVGMGHGTAVPIAASDHTLYLVTCAHVVDNPFVHTLTVTHDTHGMFRAVLVWVDEDNDLAIVACQPGKALPIWPIGPPPEYGDQLTVVGYPMTEALTAVQALAQEPGRFSGTCAPGDSGGAVLDESGRLVGIMDRCRIVGPQSHWGLIGHYRPSQLLLPGLASLQAAGTRRR